MLTIKEELFKMKLIEELNGNGIVAAIKFLFDSEVVDNLNLAVAYLEEIGLDISDEMKPMIINIMSKKQNIEDLSKYPDINVTVTHILNNWKEEKEEYVNNLLEEIKTNKKNK